MVGRTKNRRDHLRISVREVLGRQLEVATCPQCGSAGSCPNCVLAARELESVVQTPNSRCLRRVTNVAVSAA